MTVYGNYLTEALGDNLSYYIEFKRLYDDAIKSNDQKKISKALSYYKNYEYRISKSIKAKQAKKMYDELLSKVENKKPFNKQKIKSTLTKIVNKYNNDPKIKEKLKSLKASKLVCEVFEELDNEISFIICDDSQDIRIELSGIINDIGEELKKELNDPSIYINNGDGDEGCLYIYRY